MARGIKITITDYTSYVPGQCNDGGQYSFTEEYIPIANGIWEVEYSSSADFSMCPKQGTFETQSCFYCPWAEHLNEDEIECVYPSDKLLSEDLHKEIYQAQNNPDFEVRFKVVEYEPVKEEINVDPLYQPLATLADCII